jgi:hypothetical protein
MKRQIIAVLVGALGALEVARAQSYPRTHDSAGVRIVENLSRQSGPVLFALSEKPVIDVGGLEDDPAKEFNHRNGYLRAVMLSAGELVVIDMNRVHFFDAKGKRKTIFGRQGSGPEEFQYITSICRARGDTIVVYDPRNRRVTILDRNAVFVRGFSINDGSSPPFNGCLGDGTFLLTNIVRTPGPNGTAASAKYTVARMRLDGSFVDSVGVLDFGGAGFLTGRNATVFAGANRIGFASGFGDILLASVGTSAPTVRRLMFGDTELRSAPGSVMIVRSADPLQPISAAELDEQMMRTIPSNTSPDEVRQRMDRMRSMPTDKVWPAHRNVALDDGGRLWVQDFNKDYAGAHGWTAFDRDGRMIGRLLMPAVTRRFDVIGFAKDQVIVMRADEDDAKHISVYALKHAGGK